MPDNLFEYANTKIVNVEALQNALAAAMPSLFESLDTERGGVLRLIVRTSRTLTTTEEDALALLLDNHNPNTLTPVQQQEANATAAKTALATPGAAAIWTAINSAAAQSTWAGASPFLIPVLRWIVVQIVRILRAHRLTDEAIPN